MSAVLLSGAEKRALRSRAQLLEPVIRVGQAGLTDGVVKSLDEALTLHGLVKLRFTELKEERKTFAPQLADATHSVLLQIVGNVAVFYRPRPGIQETE